MLFAAMVVVPSVTLLLVVIPLSVATRVVVSRPVSVVTSVVMEDVLVVSPSTFVVVVRVSVTTSVAGLPSVVIPVVS